MQHHSPSPQHQQRQEPVFARGSPQTQNGAGASDTLRSKKSESLLEKLGGTLTRRKNQHQQPTDERVGDNAAEHHEENEADQVEAEGREALQHAITPYLTNVHLDEGEERRFMTRQSSEDMRIREIISLLINWMNDELACERIVVKHIQEDLYDGQVIQKLFEGLQGVKIEVPEVSQSEEGQRQKLQLVVSTINNMIAPNGAVGEGCKWTADDIHHKDIIAILHLLIAIALHYRAPIRFPENVSVGVVYAAKQNGRTHTRNGTEQLTTVQQELGVKGERDAFDTLFDYGPDKLAHVKSSLLAFANKHLNRINLEVTDLETQFQDGVFLILLMGLLEAYFVPLYTFQLQVRNYDGKVKNVAFSFHLMQDAGVPKPRCRPADIANGDVKSTLRLLHSLFTKYKHV